MDRWIGIDSGGTVHWGFSNPVTGPAPPPARAGWRDAVSSSGQRTQQWAPSPPTGAAPPPPPPPPPSLVLQLESHAGAQRANLSALRWAVFASADFPANMAAGPVATGTAETTDADGILSIDVSSTSLNVGDIAWLIVTDSDGTVSQSPPHMAYCGPWEVT